MSVVLEFPWFPKSLGGNSRTQHRYNKQDRETYKAIWYAQTVKHLQFYENDKKNIPISIIFHPPDNRRRDLDNALRGCKYGIDGMAKALNVDDKIFNPITIGWGDKVKHGKILVELIGVEYEASD